MNFQPLPPVLRPTTPNHRLQQNRQIAHPSNRIIRVLLALTLSALVACTANEDSNPDPMAGGALIGVNYTNNGIQVFSVDEAGGGRVGRYSISGDICCAMYPRQWTPDLRVTVEWERSDGREKDGKTWKTKSVKKTVPFEQYSEPGEVYVVFLPDDEVKVYVSTVGPKNEAFPSKLGFPRNPNETNEVKP